jgi:multiple antibiotic resistance protein
MNQAKGWTQTFPVYAAILAAGLGTLAVLRASERFNRMLGKTGINVLSRLMGLVLATMAVQFILDGLRDVGIIKS